MNYYPFHIGDYRSATSHLSNEEDLAYRRLLDMYYDTEQPIPKETKWVSRRLRVGIDVVDCVLGDFFVLKEDGWHHAKCEEVIAEYKKKGEIAKENGKKGGRPKSNPESKKNPAGFNSVPDGLPEVSKTKPEITESKANQEPITNNHKPEESLNPLVELTPDDTEKKVRGDDSEIVKTIFEYWQKVMGREKTKLDRKRATRIRSALKTHKPEEVCRAIRGCRNSGWHMGENPQGAKYNDLNAILRDTDQIDRMIALDDGRKHQSRAETEEERQERILRELNGNDGNTIDMPE